MVGRVKLYDFSLVIINEDGVVSMNPDSLYLNDRLNNMKKSIFIAAMAMAVSASAFAQGKADEKYIIPTTNNGKTGGWNVDCKN